MDTISAADTGWILTSSALVLLMTPGLAFFYGGLVRGQSVLNTMMMSVIAMGIGALCWVALGYSIAFGEGRVVWFFRASWPSRCGRRRRWSGSFSLNVPSLPSLLQPSGAVVERMPSVHTIRVHRLLRPTLPRWSLRDSSHSLAVCNVPNDGLDHPLEWRNICGWRPLHDHPGRRVRLAELWMSWDQPPRSTPSVFAKSGTTALMSSPVTAWEDWWVPS